MYCWVKSSSKVEQHGCQLGIWGDVNNLSHRPTTLDPNTTKTLTFTYVKEILSN